MKKIAAIFLSLILVVLSVVSAFADNYEVDPFTGEIIRSTDGTTVISVNSYKLNPYCNYDTNLERYVFSTGYSGDSDVTCSIYNGEITTDAVQAYFGSSSLVTVYKDGEAMDVAGEVIFSEAGAYVIRKNSSNEELFSFYIVPSVTCLLNSYQLPAGFFYTSVTKNGQQMINTGDTLLSLVEDGEYVINYKCSVTGKKTSLRLVIDHTAPQLSLDGVYNGIAQGQVVIGELEENSVLNVLRGGELHVLVGNTLTMPGVYHLSYYDEAGNCTNYDFTIRFYLDPKGWAAAIAIAVLTVIIVGYGIYCRRHMRTY